MAIEDESNADESTYEALRSGGGMHQVFKSGQVVIRETGPWAIAVHSLLQHFANIGFTKAPCLVGSGFDAKGRETLTFIEGEIIQRGLWCLEGAAATGQLLREVHNATDSFTPSDDAIWYPWFGRPLGGQDRVIGHCDFAPWNIVARQGMPFALIDWDFAGPVDPLVELAQACWLNAKLHDDIVAEREGLPPVEVRAKHLRAIVDGYRLPNSQRRGLIDLMIEFVVHDTAEQANEANITPLSTDPTPLWGLAWRARAATWLYRHRRVLQNALTS